jgi:glycosyltransferase involved in cell wall biosynthesis
MVYFLDILPPEALAGIYVLAAVHVLPSWRETPGLVSLEAAAAGCRIVTTSYGSVREYFGDLAWYCNPSDLMSIRSAVLLALEATPNHALREKILSSFTWDIAAEKTLAVYHKVLDRSY